MSIRFLLLLVSAFVFFNFTCNTEQASIPEIREGNIIVQKPPLWVKQLAVNKVEYIPSSSIGPIVYKDKVVYPTTLGLGEGEWTYIALDIHTGEQQWQWDKIETETNGHFGDREHNVYENIFMNFERNRSQGSNHELIAVDLDDGRTLWSHHLNVRAFGDNVVVFKDYFYVHFYAPRNSLGQYPTTTKPIIYRGDPRTGNFEQYLIPPIDSIRLDERFGEVGSLRGITFFTGSNGHGYMIIPYHTYQHENVEIEALHSTGNSYLALYDMTTESYVYKNALVTSGARSTFSGRGVDIYNEQVILLNINDGLYGIDLYTGELLWHQYRPGINGGGYSCIVEDGVFVACSGNGSPPLYSYGFNPTTGAELWRTETGGGARSKLAKYNGIVYWQDAGDGELYALEASSGRIVWRLKDPDPERISFWRGHDDIQILPPTRAGEKAKLFATTYLRAYCFEID